MARRTPVLIACCALFAVSGGVAPGWADGHRKCCKMEVDIDELDADLYADGDGWLLKVRYEVDVEDACASERLTLHLEFNEDDCRIGDADGRPLTRSIALDRPTRCDDDEQTFEGWAEVRLPGGAIGDPHDVEVLGSVTRVGDSCVLDKEDTSADVHRPCAVVEYAPPVVEVRHEPAVVEVRRPCYRPLVYVRRGCASTVVTVRRPYYVHVGVRW